jgi:hypothetical protein
VSKKNRVQEDAIRPLTLKILPHHSETAECSDASKCVVGQALRECPIGQFLQGWEVGSSVTKIYTGDKVIRYTTPHSLHKQIPVFDTTGKWDLPPGEYTLLPFNPNRKSRHRKIKGNKGGTLNMFKARALPSRRVMRIEKLAAI